MGIFLEGEDFRGDHCLGRLVEFRFKAPPGTISSSPLTHRRDNVTAPHGRPNLRSRLHLCHAQEGGPRSPQRTCGGIGGGSVWRKSSTVLLCTAKQTDHILNFVTYEQNCLGRSS